MASLNVMPSATKAYFSLQGHLEEVVGQTAQPGVIAVIILYTYYADVEVLVSPVNLRSVGDLPVDRGGTRRTGIDKQENTEMKLQLYSARNLNQTYCTYVCVHGVN